MRITRGAAGFCRTRGAGAHQPLLLPPLVIGGAFRTDDAMILVDGGGQARQIG